MATIHNPTNFNPADYDVQDYLDNKRPAYYGQGIDAFEAEIKWWQEDMQRVLGADWQKKCHRCVHCGNTNVRWITAVVHVTTGEVVVFGADCTERLGFADRMSWKLAQLKSKAEAGHARMKVWKQREAFLAARPEVVAAIVQAKQPAHAQNHFVQDVLNKLNRYGSLSDAQVNAVMKSLARDIEMAARKAVEAAEVKGDAPEGRQTVTGEVLGVKFTEGSYGIQVKMLVKLPNNSKVYVTVPAGAQQDGLRGSTITFTATFERSRDDRAFGFGKRPNLVDVKPAAAVAVAS